MSAPLPPLRVVVVALASPDVPATVEPLVAQARSQAQAAGRRIVEPVPVLVPAGTTLPGARPVVIPSWGDAVPTTGAGGAVAAVQRIVADDLGGIARLVAARSHRALLRHADVVVAADRRSELLVWSLRRSSRADLVSGLQALRFALEERLSRA